MRMAHALQKAQSISIKHKKLNSYLEDKIKQKQMEKQPNCGLLLSRTQMLKEKKKKNNERKPTAKNNTHLLCLQMQRNEQ